MAHEPSGAALSDRLHFIKSKTKRPAVPLAAIVAAAAATTPAINYRTCSRSLHMFLIIARLLFLTRATQFATQLNSTCLSDFYHLPNATTTITTPITATARVAAAAVAAV